MYNLTMVFNEFLTLDVFNPGVLSYLKFEVFGNTHINISECIQIFNNQQKLEISCYNHEYASLFIESGIINYREILSISQPQFPIIGADSYAYFLTLQAEGAVTIDSRLYDLYVSTPNPLNMVGGQIYYYDLFYGDTINGKFSILFKSPSWIQLANVVGLEHWTEYKASTERQCNYFQFSEETKDIQNRQITCVNQELIEGLGTRYFNEIKEILREYDPQFRLSDLDLSPVLLEQLNNTTNGFIQTWQSELGFQFANQQQVLLNSTDVNVLVRMLLKQLSRKYIQEYHLKTKIDDIYSDPTQLDKMLKRAESEKFQEFGALARLRQESSVLTSTPTLNKFNNPNLFEDEELKKGLLQKEKRLNFEAKPSRFQIEDKKNHDNQIDEFSWFDIDL